MKIDVKSKLYIGFIVAILLVLFTGVISFTTFQKQYKEAALVKHNYQVINQVELIQKLLIDMETGRRGFRSTNEEVFLEPYNNGLSSIGPSISQLKNLLNGNEPQSERLKTLEEKINDLLFFWQSINEEDVSKDKGKVIENMSIEKSKMDLIRQQVSGILQAENLNLKQHQDENNHSVSRSTYELLFCILLILLIVILLIFQILSEFKNRQRAEAGLKRNYKELTLVNQENADRNWLLLGLSKVNEVLQGHIETRELTEKVLDTVIKYLQGKSGALYLFDEEKGNLNLVASYALPDSAKQTYALNEGFVGQASIEKEPILIANLPAGSATIEGGTVRVEPVHAVYSSLFYQNELKGIIEILSFEPIGENIINFLKVISNNVASALNSVQSRERVLELLKQVQEQKEELEKQQEELRQTNEELTVQAEVLQTSEEELKVQEEELRQINAELEKKNNAIELARNDIEIKAKELEASGKYKSEFLANMSHELRTPLNSVLILAKLLADNKENNLTEKQIAHAKIIYKSGSDLLQLINDILDLSKIESGKVDLYLDEVSIETIVHDMEQLFAVVADEKEITFSTSIDPALPGEIKTDKQKLEQVIKNLLSNAFKFTAIKGLVNLSFKKVTKDNAGYFSISVADNGIGIPSDKQKLIFEAFQQADGATNRKFGGTGLGLSITKELVKMLKGQIELESEKQKGSTFTIYIPFDPGDAASEILPQNNFILTPKPAIETIEEQTKIKDDRNHLSPEDKKILIIEDDEIFASIIQNFAAGVGYKTIVALTGDEGLYCAKKYAPSAIILDLQLPGINGVTLLEIFKQDPNLKQVPVHVMSGATESETAGALAYLKKPVNKQDLEKAFLLIGEYLKAAVKRVLIFTENNSKDNPIKKLINEKNYDIIYDSAATVAEVVEKSGQFKFDCIIAELGTDIKEGIEKLNAIHRHFLPKHIPTIIYLDHDIKQADEMELKRIADVVVRESTVSSKRLMDELELFLYRVNRDKETPRKYTAATTSDAILKNKKVLLVDDDMRNIFALSAALEQEQMEISTASDGKEALEVLKKNKQPDIVLMDLMMPEMDGYETMKHIRNDLKLSKLPIIALTAKAMVGDRQKCIEAGASDYIPKPVDVQKLVALMRVWLS